jgi:predicted nucleic acid-binding protein
MDKSVSPFIIITALVEKLGGSVTITEEDMRKVFDNHLVSVSHIEEMNLVIKNGKAEDILKELHGKKEGKDNVQVCK